MFDFQLMDRPRLLLVYTDSALASRTARHFRRLGWEVQLVATADEAYQRIQDARPQVMVLDAELPGESGYLICAKLRLTGSEQKIILLAGNGTLARAEHCGASLVIGREDSIADLTDELQAVCI